jgi:hypothetical protein
MSSTIQINNDDYIGKKITSTIQMENTSKHKNQKQKKK